MDYKRWAHLSVGAQMIKWTHEPELFEPDEYEESPAAWLLDTDEYWATRYGACSVPTEDGSPCGFARDWRGRCGVESRHRRT
jgi:hypothetical protein